MHLETHCFYVETRVEGEGPRRIFQGYEVAKGNNFKTEDGTFRNWVEERKEEEGGGEGKTTRASLSRGKFPSITLSG